MAFLTLTKDGDTIELEIDAESARQAEPESIGSTTRAFNGGFRSDKEEFRVWNFVAVNVFPDMDADIRTMCRNDAAIDVAGDAMNGETVTGIVMIGEAPFWDDARSSTGFTRSLSLTIKEG